MKFASKIILLSLFFSQGIFAIEFDNKEFKKVWGTIENKAKIIEFIPLSEKIESWMDMITYRCHVDATQLKQVVGPYYSARSELVAMKPEASKNESNYSEDVNLVLFLGSHKTQYIEFVIARFIRPSNIGVFAVIYSHRIPSSDNIDVSMVMKNKENWINQLRDIKAEEIIKACGSVKLDT